MSEETRTIELHVSDFIDQPAVRALSKLFGVKTDVKNSKPNDFMLIYKLTSARRALAPHIEQDAAHYEMMRHWSEELGEKLPDGGYKLAPEAQEEFDRRIRELRQQPVQVTGLRLLSFAEIERANELMADGLTPNELVTISWLFEEPAEIQSEAA